MLIGRSEGRGDHKVQIPVRRGGPNYQEGVRIIREVGMLPLIYLGRGVLIGRRGRRGDHKVQIFVRRGGPNYQEGLRIMREVGMFPSICLGEGGVDRQEWREG